MFWKWEKPGKLQSAMLKKKTKNNIACIRAENNWMTTNSKEINSAFYEKSYDSTNADLPQYCSNNFLEIPIISCHERTELNKPITLTEISDAIHSLSKNKSPGPDGNSAKFLSQYVWKLIRRPLQMVVSHLDSTNHKKHCIYKKD